MQVICSGCKQPVEVDDPKRPQVFNLAAVSLIVVEHAEQSYCAQCRAPVTLQIIGMQALLLGAVPVPPAEQKRLIVMPAVQ